MTKKRVFWAAFGVVATTGVVLALWAFWFEPRRLIIRNAELALPHWVNRTSPLRVAVLTDLHVGSPHNGLNKLERIVQKVNERDPDIVLILGDLVIQGVIGGEFVAPEQIAAQLGQLRSRCGTYAVLGNHDWWLDPVRVGAALRANGIAVLEDSASALGRTCGPLWVAGVSDFWEGKHDVAAALRMVPLTDPVIVFTHNPDIFPQIPERVSLTVAGHTHGGQVRFPLIGAPVVPSRFGQRYVGGHVAESGRHLFVSSGTGTSMLPVRFRVPPEIAMLELRADQSGGQ